MNILSFLLHRLRQRWQMLILLLISVTVSAGLLASGPLLVDAVMRFALPYVLQTAEPLDSGLRLSANDLPDLGAYQGLDGQLREKVNENLGTYLAQVIASAGSNSLYPWYLDQLATDQRIQIHFMQDIQTHTRLVEGTWPEIGQQARAVNDKVIYAAIPSALGVAFDIQVGERLPLSKQEHEGAPSAWLEVTGILEPIQGQEAYWFGSFSPMIVHSEAGYVAGYNVFVDEASLFLLQAELFPKARVKMNWNILIEPQLVQVENVPHLVGQIERLRSGLGEIKPAVTLQTHMKDVLEDFVRQARVVRITLYVVIAEVLFLALYFLNMAAGLAVQQVEGEFANLASRGASFGQVFKIQVVEAALVGLVGLVAGPLLAWLAIWALGHFGPFAGLAQAEWMPRMPMQAWLAAGIGSLAGAIFLLAPVYQAVQRSVVTHIRRKTRPDKSAWWQRAYLDVLAALAALLLTWRLGAYGSLATRGQLDWLLLLTPLTLLVSTAILLLRLFPLAMQALAWLSARSRGLPATLALWYTARNPAQVVRLVLLLALTMALGMLSTGLDKTLDLVEGERALYAVGSDLRIMLGNSFAPIDSSALQGVTATSRVLRGKISVNVVSRRVAPFMDMLAIEPYSFASVTRYRDDYAEQPIGQLLGRLVVDNSPQAGLLLPLPGTPDRFGVWVYDQKSLHDESHLVDSIHLQAKLETATSESFLTNLLLMPVAGRETADPRPDDEWRYFEAELPLLPAECYPLSLHSLWMIPRRQAQESFSYVQLYIDDISAIDRQSGELIVVEDFESIIRIWQSNQEYAVTSFSRKAEAYSGIGSLSVWTPSVSTGDALEIYLAEGFFRKPMPVLVSQEFIKTMQVEVGDRIYGYIGSIEVLLVISGVVDYFPTLYDSPAHGFMILPRDVVLAYLNRQQRMPINANELWAETTDWQAAEIAAKAIPTASDSMTVNNEQEAIRADPLSLGLRSATMMGAILAAGLSLIGFATYLSMSIRQREAIFAILRAMGLSPGGLYGMLAIEQLVTVLAGVVLGTLLGILLNRLVVPGLPLSLGGRPAIPPMLALTDWTAILQLYLVLIGAFLMMLGTATIALLRTRLQRMLRIGQE